MLSPLALADVTVDLGNADDRAGGVTNGRERRGYGDRRAVEMELHGLEIHYLAAPGSLEDGAEFHLSLRRDQSLERQAEGLLLGEAVQPHRRGVRSEEHTSELQSPVH